MIAPVSASDFRLRQVARDLTPTELAHPSTQALAAGMLAFAAGGSSQWANCVGLAANQFGFALNLVVVDLNGDRMSGPEPRRAPGYVALANLRVKPIGSQLITGIEGCISADRIAGRVKRFRQVAVEAVQLGGESFIGEYEGVNGFLARIFQHEADHTQGRTFLARVESDEDIWNVLPGSWPKLMADPGSCPPAPPDQVALYRSYSRTM